MRKTRLQASMAALACAAVLSACAATRTAVPIIGPDATATADASQGAPSEDEIDLYDRITEYRREHRLPPVPLSRSLTHIARLHAADLGRNGFGASCNIHSWSKQGPWRACCYRPDHSDPSCMWNKPRELTTYKGLGFEVAYWTSAVARPATVLAVWKKSTTHDEVLLERGRWRGQSWKAIGVAVAGKYAVLWFGTEDDPAGYWRKQ